jgi:hypothetical protein
MGMTRRRMLAAIPAAIALAGAKVFGHGEPAQAADGDALILGQMNSAGTPTQLSSAALNGTFLVRNVYHGALEGTGMVGTTGQGVAEAGSIGVLALGVQHGTALQVQGETKFIDVSGLATVPMGSRAVKVRPSRFVTTTSPSRRRCSPLSSHRAALSNGSSETCARTRSRSSSTSQRPRT